MGGGKERKEYRKWVEVIRGGIMCLFFKIGDN